jgi:hypothetical protein
VYHRASCIGILASGGHQDRVQMDTPLKGTSPNKIVGFHDATRLTTLRNSAMLGPSHPDTKARCAAMMNTPL